MRVLRYLSAVLAALSLMVGVAAASPPTAQQTVKHTTERVMVLIDEANDYFEQDPDRFYSEVEQILDDIVDFNSFSRGVMGPYATKDYYMQLASSDAKQLFKAQVKRFSEVFRGGLVQTYAKGLLAFGGTRIEVIPAEPGDSQSSTSVMQKIYGAAENPYEVLYKMRKDKRGAWKVRNVTIEAVNLGKVYQGQFISAAKQYEGDLDKVIDNWSVAPAGQEPQP